MSFTAKVDAGWTYTTGDTATASNLNALGNPTVTIEDGKTYAVGVGSLSAPGIAFNGDPNTGWAQLAGADTMSAVAGGTEIVRITSTQVGFANGSNAAPSITFIGDGNTGFNHDAGDEIDVVCGGTVIGTFGTTGLGVTGAISATSITVGGATVLTTGVNTSTVSVATDFLGASGSWGTTSTVVTTGTVTAVSPPGHGTEDTGSRGFAKQVVNAVGDRAVVTFPFSCLPSTGYARFRIRASALSTPSQRYEVLVGMFNVLTTTSSAGSGAWFQYVDSASAQIQTVTYNGTTRETQTTAITYTNGNDYTFEIRHTAASTFAFYINGALVTTHSTVTFSSTTANLQYIGAGIEKLVGTGDSTLYLDSIEGNSPLTRT